MIAVTEQPPSRCSHCHADAMGCDVKRGLSGLACCQQCDGDHDHPKENDR